MGKKPNDCEREEETLYAPLKKIPTPTAKEGTPKETGRAPRTRSKPQAPEKRLSEIP